MQHLGQPPLVFATYQFSVHRLEVGIFHPHLLVSKQLASSTEV